MPAVYTFASAPTTSAEAAPVRIPDNYAASITVRGSTTYDTSTATTDTSDFIARGALGLVLYIDQSAVSASSAGGGTGTMTHTIQQKDSGISANYVNSTGAVTTTTGTGTWVLNCYPGMGTASPTSGASGKADLALGGTWRIRSSASSSATNFTYSVAAIYLPPAGASS